MIKYKLVYNIKELNTASEDGYHFFESLDLNTWLVGKDDDDSELLECNNTLQEPKEEVKEPEKAPEEPTEPSEELVEVPNQTQEESKTSK